ncbi:thiamine phosphate synthase [Novacetimonas hansenii]|uniref:Thiamine-phosphate synthase n=2 Tax=Novacetimonas hansenii TaxID=436 RepID=A0AAW5ENX3_NOVHA|nr:thiamine phosphate synthase [Novacetimonas hansenii]EFG85649.1 thiamine-phosphate pyrophosphorylase [Novacetimonas hansenii ATCC 23769]MCJ8353432.1 thiamine phosphate synthase [Novacetimonas hansenii]RFP00322.1 thiamine-phosphate diphosphorylase [Novacetimonas hansenii]WEQ57878.1 thiamine phosphate synthase [Novacetimonas hansenii]CUW46208.1 Thiamine-phosphate synthase [Novacetimonas hansenii]
MTDCQLYLVTPESLDPTQFAPLLARALDAGPVAAVQLRLKDVPDDTIRRAIDVLRPTAHERDVAFILNDRPDLARDTGCDGAHVGMDDMSVEEARRMLGDDLQLGVSCYDSRDMAMHAGEGGADYIAFGAFFPSPSKETSVRAGTDLLAWWSTMMELPVVAIGGITPENCGPLVHAGADFLAVISAVWSHPDGPDAGVRAMNAAMDRASDAID